MAVGLYSFSVDRFTIANTRSRGEDTDYISASVAVAGRPTVSATQSLGNLNNGTYSTTMQFNGIPVDDNETAVFTYLIINSGHSDPSVVVKGLEAAASALASKGAQLVATAAGGAIGAALGAAIGTAAVPLIGTALGALAGWVVSSVGALLFANCDGPVAAAVHTYTGAQLRAAGGAGLTGNDNHPGSDSPSGCGSNSDYTTFWTVKSAAAQTGDQLVGTVTLQDTTSNSPALAVLGNAAYLAWTGVGNNELNVSCSVDGGRTFAGKATSGNSSPAAPALAAHLGALYLAWTGSNNNLLNLMKADVTGTAVVGFSNQATLGQTSAFTPAIASFGGKLYVAWTGSGNLNLNIASSADGVTLDQVFVSGETSANGPALTVHDGKLLLGWKGNGNDNLNIGIVQTAGALALQKLATLPDTSNERPCMVSNGQLVLGWKGDGNFNLNFEASQDDGKTFGGKFTSRETSDHVPAIAVFEGVALTAWVGHGNQSLNVARVAI